MEYPDDNKAYQTKIIKFDRDYKEEMIYNFYGMFPQQLNSIPVKYEGSQVLKATATFMFDRYSAGRFSSYDRYRGNYNNLKANKSKPEGVAESNDVFAGFNELYPPDDIPTISDFT